MKLYEIINKNINNKKNQAGEAFGTAVGTALIAPHIILLIIAIILNWIGFFTNIKGFALAGGIIYIVAGVLFILYFLFVIPSTILSFVGYSKLKKTDKQSSVAKN